MDFQNQTDKMVANQPVVVDVAIASESNTRKEEYEKLEKYQRLKEKQEVSKWGVNASAVPVVMVPEAHRPMYHFFFFSRAKAVPVYFFVFIQ